MNNTLIKIILAVLLILCLFNLPYGYYQFVRFAAMVGFGYLAFDSNNRGNTKEMFVYIVLAILFQPLLKIALGRVVWNIVDVVVAIGLLVSLSSKQKNKY